MYTDDEGKNHFEVNSYNGTFDWTYDELYFNAVKANPKPEKISFNIFLAISGTIWIDDVKIEYIK